MTDDIPIDPDEIARIEQSLGITLPQSYARLLLDDPFDGGIEEFYGTADEIIEYTATNRADGFFGCPWSDHYLVIGSDGTGDQYFLDLSLGPSPVFIADHERSIAKDCLVISERATDIVTFFERVRANWEAFRAEEVEEVE